MKFKLLWDAHPENWGEFYPCHSALGEPFFENQCAIKMGVTLARVHFEMDDYHGVRCWHHPGFDNHTLRVEELREYLLHKLPKHSLTIIKKPRDSYIPSDSFDGRSGIIVCKDFWGDNGQGDHIDLLTSEGEMACGDTEYIERASSVYFWEID